MSLDLIEKIRKNDVNAFEKLFKTYYKLLVRYAAGIVKSTDIGEELVQDLFCRLWEKRKSLIITASVKSYLMRATYNAAMENIRTIDKNDLLKKGVLNNHKPDIFREFDEKENELIEKIVQAIENMPDQQRKIFKMNRFDGLKYREIADLLNISIKTVENHIGNALKLLRNSFRNNLTILLIFIKKMKFN